MNAATRDRVLFAAAIAVGAGAWFAVAGWTGERDAWDAPLFASLGLPLAYGACLGLGFFGSRQAWRWPLLVFGALAASSIVGAGGGRSPGPLALMLIGLMMAVGLVPTYLGVGLRRVFDAVRARRAAADARLRSFADETGRRPGA